MFRKLMKKSVWGIPLWWIPTIIVVAWSVLYFFAMQYNIDAGIQEVGGPHENVTLSAFNCQILSGSGTVVSSVATGTTLDCEYAGWNEDTVARATVLIVNDEAYAVVVENISLPGPYPGLTVSTEFFEGTNPIPPGEHVTFNVVFTADPALVALAGTSIDLSTSYEINEVP